MIEDFGIVMFEVSALTGFAGLILQRARRMDARLAGWKRGESYAEWQARIRATASAVEARIQAERSLLVEPGNGHVDTPEPPAWGTLALSSGGPADMDTELDVARAIADAWRRRSRLAPAVLTEGARTVAHRVALDAEAAVAAITPLPSDLRASARTPEPRHCPVCARRGDAALQQRRRTP